MASVDIAPSSLPTLAVNASSSSAGRRPERSLTRRPRTKSRRRGSPRRQDDNRSLKSVQSEIALPSKEIRNRVFLSPSGDFPVRARALSTGADTELPEMHRGRLGRPEADRDTKRQSRGASVPRQIHCPPAFSDSSDEPSPLTPGGFSELPPTVVFHREQGITRRIRGSIATQASTTSSSIYPPSTMTSAVTEESLQSPPSLLSDPHRDTVITVDPEDYQDLTYSPGFNADDVSSRLRLLVQNNYYLPPAHSKPYPADFSILAEPQKKNTAPGFLEYFRVGKTRPKASTTDPARKNTQPPAPMLRTTADTSTVSDSIRPPATKSMPHSPVNRSPLAAPYSSQTRKGRVVVVRETMDDIFDAAAQAEEELKAKRVLSGAGRDESRHSHKADICEKHIDPTDVVDIPQGPGHYLLGPQSSTVNGLGIETAIGADMLADRLPPGSPGMWSVDPVEERWRKALLHEAVNHSLNNSIAPTPDTSGSVSHPSIAMRCQKQDMITGHAADMHNQLRVAVATETQEGLTTFLSEAVEPTIYSANSAQPRVFLKKGPPSLLSHDASRYGETQGTGLISLNPPPAKSPRRQTVTDSAGINENHDASLGASNTHVIRKAMSTPTLPSHRVSIGDLEMNSPKSPGLRSIQENESFLMMDEEDDEPGLASSYLTAPSVYSESHHDESDDPLFHTPEEQGEVIESRPSLTVSTVYDMGDSQPSPTISAFRDGLGCLPDARTPSPYRLSPDSRGGNSSFTPELYPSRRRDYAMSPPPPRASSTYSPMGLSPAPRPLASYGAVSMRPSFSTCRSSYDTQHYRQSPADDNEDAVKATPSCSPNSAASRPSIAVRRQSVNLANLTLHVPDQRNALAYPPSPIAFFDEVEMHHRNSVDWSDDDHSSPLKPPVFIARQESPVAGTSIAHQMGSDRISLDTFSQKSTRSIFSLDNSSMPQIVAPSPLNPERLGISFDVQDRKRPITNVPPPSPSRSTPNLLFGKRDKSRERILTGLREVASAMNQYGRPATSPSPNPPYPAGTFTRSDSPSSSDAHPNSSGSQSSGAWRRDHSVQDETVRRLDVLLEQHMEQEKDTLRRIAKTVNVKKAARKDY